MTPTNHNRFGKTLAGIIAKYQEQGGTVTFRLSARMFSQTSAIRGASDRFIDEATATRNLPREERIMDPENGAIMLAALGAQTEPLQTAGGIIFTNVLETLWFTRDNNYSQVVDVMDTHRLARLLFSEYNASNPNPKKGANHELWFEIIDEKADAKKRVNRRLDVARVQAKIGDLSETQVDVFCDSLGLPFGASRTDDDKRDALLTLASNNWQQVEATLDGNLDTTSRVIARAVEKGFISFHPEENGVYKWADTKDVLLMTGNKANHAALLGTYLLDANVPDAVDALSKLKKLTKFKD